MGIDLATTSIFGKINVYVYSQGYEIAMHWVEDEMIAGEEPTRSYDPSYSYSLLKCNIISCCQKNASSVKLRPK